MSQPRPTASESQDKAIKDRELLAWLKTAATHSLPPSDFGSLQIAHAAAYKDKKDELPEWAWAEYQVIYDTHASVTKAPRLFHKNPSIFEITQWRNARKNIDINRSLFPVSGAIGSPIPPPQPTAGPTMPDPSPLDSLEDSIPIGAPETNEEMGEEADDGWPTGTMKPATGISEHEPPASDLETQPPPPETAIEITQTSDTQAPMPSPSEEFDNDTNYMTGLVGESPVPVHYLAWLIRHTMELVKARLEQTDAAVIALHPLVDKQTRTINALTTTLQEVRKEIKSKTTAPHPPPPAAPKEKGKNPATKSNDKETKNTNQREKKSYAAAATNDSPNPQTNFTTVQRKTKKAVPLFVPEYTRLNRQVMVETSGPLPPLITNDDILDIVNEATTVQGLKFLSAQRSANGNLRFETNPSTSADEGAKYHVEISLALDKLHIQATNIYPNSRWSKFVIHGVPSHIGTTNTTELSSRVAQEIYEATNISMAQPPRWLNSAKYLEEKGSGNATSRKPDQITATPSASGASSTATTRNHAPKRPNAAHVQKTTYQRHTHAKQKTAQEDYAAHTPRSVAQTAPQD
ncbi:hypothetical protein Q9L58_010542 [Maublancomyces gigas]|uniref:Uncharacterized protein n=1 Tax=Discina gigas TaxID=1032678 RepID=A0ABR3G4T7_9PEZI